MAYYKPKRGHLRGSLHGKVAALSEALGLSPFTVYNWHTSGELEYKLREIALSRQIEALRQTFPLPVKRSDIKRLLK